MKIKKLKFYLTVIGLVGGISLINSCNNSNKTNKLEEKIAILEEELDNTNKKIDQLNEIVEISQIHTLNDLNNYLGTIRFSLLSNFSPAHPNAQSLIINCDYNTEITFPDEIYSKIKELLAEYEINKLYIVGLNNELDFGKLIVNTWDNDELHNIETIILNDVGENFDYMFIPRYPKHIQIYEGNCNNLDMMKNYLSITLDENSSLDIYSNNLYDYLAFLKNENIMIDSLNISTFYTREHDTNLFPVLSNVKAKNITIEYLVPYYITDELDLNISLGLDEQTESVNLILNNRTIEGKTNLSKINIISNNTNLNVNINSIGTEIIYVPEDIHINLPNNSTISFDHLDFISFIKYINESEEINLDGTIKYEENDTIQNVIIKLNENKEKEKQLLLQK